MTFQMLLQKFKSVQNMVSSKTSSPNYTIRFAW